MNRPPADRRSPAVLILPFVAIGGALGFGAFLNRGHAKKNSAEDAPVSVTLKPGTGVVIGKMASGLKPPLRKDGTPVFPRIGFDNAGPVAWASIDFIGSEDNLNLFRSGLATGVKDETGSDWPNTVAWDGNTFYFGIPRGYSSAAKKLTATLTVDRREFAKAEIPPLPKPKPLAPPPLTPPWKGLVAEACYQDHDVRKRTLFYIDAPIEPGHILAATIHGTTYARESMDYFNAIKGPDAGPYNQMTFFPLNYPDGKGKAYIDVVEFAPVHIRKRLHFKSFVFADKFGSPWIIGPGSVEKLSDGVFFRMTGNDKVPFRAPGHGRRNVILSMQVSGLVMHVTATLVSPISARSIPFLIRSDMFKVRKTTSADAGVDWKSGALEFVVDFEADVYHMVRQATVAVDMSSPRVKSNPRGNIQTGLVISKDSSANFFDGLGRGSGGGGPRVDAIPGPRIVGDSPISQ